MVIGGFLCLWLLAMGIWLTNKSYKLWVKVSYWIWLFLTCGLATAFGILNCYILSRCSLSRWGEKMWKQMRADGMESILCSIQQHYRCQGWNSQVNETIPCSHNSTQSMPFCVNWIALSLQHYFLPQAFAFLLVSLMGWIELYSFIVVHKK